MQCLGLHAAQAGFLLLLTTGAEHWTYMRRYTRYLERTDLTQKRTYYVLSHMHARKVRCAFAQSWHYKISSSKAFIFGTSD